MIRSFSDLVELCLVPTGIQLHDALSSRCPRYVCHSPLDGDLRDHHCVHHALRRSAESKIEFSHSKTCALFVFTPLKISFEYKTRMTERWGSTGSTVVTVMSNLFYIAPYFLFYFGLGFRYGSYNEALLSTARFFRTFRSTLNKMYLLLGFCGHWISSFGISGR